jgi:pimeloyl-ACP methyl ester carboxylesterase
MATVGLVFYPGGRVDHRAYAPAARDIASAGFIVVVVPMPLHLAVLAPDKARDVMAAYPEVGDWAVGGHSLGGVMAARFVHHNPDVARGLVLWAAYPADDNDLSARELAVTSVYATQDGVAPPEEILAGGRLLPADTAWIAIEGGNHAQFGWYGPQNGDNDASISREEQQAKAVDATVELLLRLR